MDMADFYYVNVASISGYFIIFCPFLVLGTYEKLPNHIGNIGKIDFFNAIFAEARNLKKF